MREVKFRAWHLGDKRIVPWHEMRDDHYDLYELCNNGHTLMQYTGLKDRNGKEIYESDILQDSGGHKWSVGWHDDHACFGVVSINAPYVVTEIIDNLNMAVVANIYQP